MKNSWGIFISFGGIIMLESFKDKYYSNSSSFRRLIDDRVSKFNGDSIMRKISTLILMLYMWPVKKAFNDNNIFFVNVANMRKRYFECGKSYIDVNTLSHEQKNYYAALQDLFHIYAHRDFNLVRLGAEYDGGYIILDDFISNSRGGVSVI